ncbi:hypothetical protein [Oceanibium sediminis]|uniref:hypothetical protein n=1 Tax=Oceanibium sediminis TaxID=2026339 RepID=UPI0013007C87|nr:hypothetical protein [Oceanibium sediminis]
MIYPTWILERSFGGLGVAVSPLNGALQSRWPDGRSSPMSAEACQAMMIACSAADNLGPAHMVFLVGGAGNGKSKLAADVVACVNGTARDEPSAFAQRCYAFDLPNGRGLRVVNDATIPPADKQEFALQRDIVDALEAGDHFLGCINRGVLIGERQEPDSLENDNNRVASAIISWLLEGELPALPTGNAEIKTAGESEDASENYGFARIRIAGNLVAVVHLVYMDNASLLEEWPESEPATRTDAALPSCQPKVTPLLDRERGEVESAFEGCLSKLASGYLNDLPAENLDPVRSNTLSLSNTSVARGWCSVMRGAEILSGTHFSYRELWALASHSIIGPLASEALGELQKHVQLQQDRVRNGNPQEQVRSAIALGNLRAHMLLFDAGRRKQGDEAGDFGWPETSSDALKAIQFADPLKHFGPRESVETSFLDEAINGLKDGHLPGASLAETDKLVRYYWTPLDARIEEIVSHAVNATGENSLTLKDRSRVLSWYGRYLYRLKALASGWPAHVSIVSEWQNTWIDAHLGRRMNPDLEDAVLDILAPLGDDGRTTYFTFLQPRVSAGDNSANKVRIEIPRQDVLVGMTTSGDRLDLAISLRSQSGGTPSAFTTLDFHLLREAMARQGGHGFTDSLLVIEPRIERLRAAMVATQIRSAGSRSRYGFSDRRGLVKG